MKDKNRVNGLEALNTDDGRMVANSEDIEKEILQFYGMLVGKPSDKLSGLDIEVLRNRNQVSVIHDY